MIDRVELRIAGGWNNLRLEFRTAAQRDRVKDCYAEFVDQTLLIAPGEGVAHDGWEAQCNSPGYRYCIHVACSERYKTPRFGVIELEGVFESTMLRIDLPPLHELPWPKLCGENKDRELLRTAAERLLWGQAHGFFKTKMDAASYLRRMLPPADLRRFDAKQWQGLLNGLSVPAR